MKFANSLQNSYVFRTTRSTNKYFGFRKAALYLLYEVLNKFARLHIYECLYLTDKNINPEFLYLEKKYRCGFLKDNQLISLANDKKFNISPQFLRTADQNGDKCFAISEGNQIANLTWYTNKSNLVTGDLIVDFDPSWSYAYNGYTPVAYRGQRLLGVGLALGCKELTETGSKGMFTLIEFNNFSSLKSVYRLGFCHLGRIMALKLSQRYFILTSTGCRNSGLELRTVTT